RKFWFSLALGISDIFQITLDDIEGDLLRRHGHNFLHGKTKSFPVQTVIRAFLPVLGGCQDGDPLTCYEPMRRKTREARDLFEILWKSDLVRRQDGVDVNPVEKRPMGRFQTIDPQIGGSL